MSVLQELKNRTQDLHQRIEGVVPLLNPELTLDEYAGYLEQLFPFYCSVEARLTNIPRLRAVVNDLDERWKTGLLEQDLRALGHSPARGIESIFVPELRNLPQALGCLYVLEGSTLGGQILLRTVRSRFGESIAGKTSFLASYGDHVAEKWRTLCAALTSALPGDEEGDEGGGGDLDQAVAAARSTFQHLHDWLLSRQAIRQEARQEACVR